MKDSGIEWIGEIPKEWDLRKVSRIFNLIGSGTTPRSNYDKYYSEEGFNWLQTGDLNDSNIYFTTKKITKDAITDCSMKKYPINSLVMAMYGATIGKMGILKIPTFTNQACCVMSGGNIHYYKYSYYTLLACRQNLINQAYGGGQPNISQDLIKKTVLLVPAYSEQHRIANFLDEKCKDIDTLINLQEEMITELQVYKQSVISEAVTKGLNPNVTMKDSGMEWLGEIPNKWILKPIKFLFNRRSQKNNPVITQERLSLSIDKGVTLYSEKTTNLDRFKDDFTQYQIAYPNDIVLNCMNMIVGAVGLSQYTGCVSPVYYVIQANSKDILPKYYALLLNIKTIRGLYYSYGKGIYAIDRGDGRVNTCRLKVAYNDFARIEVPVPSLHEQQEIINYLDTKCAQIDELIALKQQKITSLQDYKKSLIYEYVTGKKEVPDNN